MARYDGAICGRITPKGETMNAQQNGSPEKGAYRTFEVELLCGAGGAEVSGLDISRPLPPETLAELRSALADHCVLFFRDQDLTPEQQKAFALQFGPLSATPFIKPLDGHLEMMRIVREADEKKKLNFGGRWHSDMTVDAAPVPGRCSTAAKPRRSAGARSGRTRCSPSTPCHPRCSACLRGSP